MADLFDVFGKGVQSVLSFVGQQQSNDTAMKIAEQNRAAQESYANSSIQRRVADANAAGINPLYALGAQTIAAPALEVGAIKSPLSAMSSSLGDAISSLKEDGQDVSRAAVAPHSMGAKVAAVSTAQALTGTDLDLENKQLRNTLLRSQIAKLNAGTAPGVSETGEFTPELNKPGKRTPIMIGGKRLQQHEGTSDMQDVENRYGDEGPVAATFPFLVLDQDLQKTYGPPSSWPGHVMRWFVQQVHEDWNREVGNARRFFGRR